MIRHQENTPRSYNLQASCHSAMPPFMDCAWHTMVKTQHASGLRPGDENSNREAY